MEIFGRNWVLLSAADVKDCMHKVQPVKYAEEICYNGTLILKAFSSGLEIGTCNWAINGPNINIACLSSSIFVSSHAMNFDYHALQGYDLILYSDFSPPDVMEDTDDDNCFALASDNFSAISFAIYCFSDDSDTQDMITESLLNADDSEEMEKLAFISSCAIDSVKAGGSILIPIGRLGIFLQLLESISSILECSNLKLYSGEPLFAHVDLIKEKKLHLFPAVHSDKLLLQKVQPLLKMLQPKVVLFPENLRQHFGFSITSSISFIPYSENETLRIPSLKLNSELDIATDLVFPAQLDKVETQKHQHRKTKGRALCRAREASVTPWK
ncbi:hypothetical protein Acr_15g0012180 [Actinidia rufa]|uniref:Uncharacterized protein n=1 Tax=Actinidia rufa TaxID=165716 RepID=A0A7J0FWT2_9ERIC|nr:hypothetical protein Acr_15g0012180 [Actinidia rufa]